MTNALNTKLARVLAQLTDCNSSEVWDSNSDNVAQGDYRTWNIPKEYDDQIRCEAQVEAELARAHKKLQAAFPNASIQVGVGDKNYVEVRVEVAAQVEAPKAKEPKVKKQAKKAASPKKEKSSKKSVKEQIFSYAQKCYNLAGKPSTQKEVRKLRIRFMDALEARGFKRTTASVYLGHWEATLELAS